MDWRIVACVGLFVAPALSGCLGERAEPSDASRLAQPTDRPAEVPGFANRTAPVNATPDFNDPGYPMDLRWAVGDEWNYASNQSNYRNVRVLREETSGERRLLVVQEEGNRRGNPPSWRAVSYVDAATLVRLNYTYLTGIDSYAWTPGNPQEVYLRNGTFAYNETKLERGAEAQKLVVRANSWLSGFESVPLLWGKTTAGRVEHRILKTDATGASTRELAIRFPVREYGADAQYQAPSGELWRLAYVKHGGLELGTPLRW